MKNVSVITPAYNQSHYLGEAIQSVLLQTYPEFEIVVVDDGSTDGTAEVAQSFQDARIRYLYQENRGLSAARNTGIQNSNGEYLTFLDSDDKFLPDKLAILVEELESHPDICLAAGQAIPIDETGKSIGKTFDKPIPGDLRQLLMGNPLHVGSVLLRRSCQQEVGYFDETLRSYEDWDMWLRLARNGCRMTWIPRPVSYYRFHTAQMTRIGGQMTKATFAVLDNVFDDPDLPESWKTFRLQAYSNAYLRAAAQAYLAKDFQHASDDLRQAITLNPELITGNAHVLADHFLAWTDLPKVADPLTFLDEIFAHLPDEATLLKRNRREHLGRAAIQIAFQSYLSGDYRTTRTAVLRAIKNKPQLVINRGVLSIFVRSSFR